MKREMSHKEMTIRLGELLRENTHCPRTVCPGKITFQE